MTEEITDFPSKEDWEAQRAQEAFRQNLEPGQVPEQRPQGTIAPPPEKGEVSKKLSAAGSNLAHDAPAHGYEEHKAAHSAANARKAARQSMGPERMYPGAHCYINNPDGEGSEHHGRAVAVNAVSEFASPEDEALSNSGANPDRRFAKVKAYECSSRDGRAELLIVSAEHLSKVPITEYHRTVT